MEVSPTFEQPIEEVSVGSSSPLLVAIVGAGRLRLVGELDLAEVPVLRAVLADVDGDVEMDCSGLTFIDCAGLRVLEETRQACEAAGVRFSLVAPSRCLTRLLDLVGLDGVFDVRDGWVS